MMASFGCDKQKLLSCYQGAGWLPCPGGKPQMFLLEMRIDSRDTETSISPTVPVLSVKMTGHGG